MFLSKKNIIIFLLLFLSFQQVLAQLDNGITYRFTQTDSSYNVYGAFKVKALPMCVMNICFNQNHIKALATEAKEVRLIKKGENWNQLSYTYRKLKYFKNVSVWMRKIDRENGKIEFVMLSSKNSHEIMPEMKSSSGYYKITEIKDSVKVEYNQKCQLTNSSLTKIQISIVKKGALKFMDKFRSYIHEQCGLK